MKEITFTIDEKGQVTISVSGVRGKGCTDITKAFENAIGKVQDRKKKLEYNLPGDPAGVASKR